MIVLPATVVAAIRRAAETAYPEECCGLLVGRSDRPGQIAIVRAVAARNVSGGDRRRRFEVDPAAHFQLLRDVRGRNETMVGHYHSHPDHPAAPSSEDLAMAFEPNLIWLIVAVNRGSSGDLLAFRPNEDGTAFLPLKLQIGVTGSVAEGN